MKYRKPQETARNSNKQNETTLNNERQRKQPLFWHKRGRDRERGERERNKREVERERREERERGEKSGSSCSRVLLCRYVPFCRSVCRSGVMLLPDVAIMLLSQMLLRNVAIMVVRIQFVTKCCYNGCPHPICHGMLFHGVALRPDVAEMVVHIQLVMKCCSRGRQCSSRQQHPSRSNDTDNNNQICSHFDSSAPVSPLAGLVCWSWRLGKSTLEARIGPHGNRSRTT